MSTEEKKKSMIRKSLVAVVIVAIALPCLLLGGWAMIALSVAVVFFACYEMASLKDQKPHWRMTIFLAASISIMLVVDVSHRIALIGILLVLLIIISLSDEHYDISYISTIFLVSFIMVLAISTIEKIYISEELGRWVMLYVVIACTVCDTGAYFFGSFLGKNKMIERVSPNKTWEGAVGGYICGAALSLLFGTMVLTDLPQDMILAASCILPAVAEVGDLTFSLIKRNYHVKDFGSLLPGHGGILDRVDSLFVCLMIFYPILLAWGL